MAGFVVALGRLTYSYNNEFATRSCNNGRHFESISTRRGREVAASKQALYQLEARLSCPR